MTLLQRLLRTIGLSRRPGSLSGWMKSWRSRCVSWLTASAARRQSWRRSVKRGLAAPPGGGEQAGVLALPEPTRAGGGGPGMFELHQPADRRTVVTSSETVKSHVANILHKFGLRRRPNSRQYLDNWDFSAWDAGSSPQDPQGRLPHRVNPFLPHLSPLRGVAPIR